MSNFSPKSDTRAGFTLAEILLAMLVFSIAITTILALLARSIETVDEIVLKDEAMRLSSAVERTLTNMAFDAVYDGVSAGNPIEMHAFHYRVNPENRQPQPDRSVADVLVLPFAEGLAHDDTDAAFQARDGRYFRVRLQLSPTNPIAQSAMPENADDYPSAALVLFARFYSVGGPAVTTIPDGARVIYSYNFAVRR